MAVEGNSSVLGNAMEAVVRYLMHARLPRAQEDACIIVGNGPSFLKDAECHRDALCCLPVFSVNHFVETDFFYEFKPVHYCLLDKVFFKYQLSEDEKEIQLRILMALVQRTKWPMHLFFPFFPDQIRLGHFFKDSAIDLRMYNMFPPVVGRGSNYVYRSNLFMPPTQNVLIPSIYLAINMGYKRIYILGADHSWAHDMEVRTDNVVCMKHCHFDRETELMPSYEPGVLPRRTRKMHEWYRSLYLVFLSYQRLNEYARFRGAEVFNASSYSLIDAFPRVSSIQR